MPLNPSDTWLFHFHHVRHFCFHPRSAVIINLSVTRAPLPNECWCWIDLWMGWVNFRSPSGSFIILMSPQEPWMGKDTSLPVSYDVLPWETKWDGPGVPFTGNLPELLVIKNTIDTECAYALLISYLHVHFIIDGSLHLL